MILEVLSQVPPWLQRLILSLVAILTAYLVGRFISRTVCRRLVAWASKTAWKWDELVIESLGRGIPTWSLLVGLIGAASFWQLPDRVFTLFTRGVYVVLWLSMTLIFAGLVGRLVVLYSSQFERTVPVASITQNVAKIIIVVIGLLMILNGMGISIAPVLTALGVGGLAVALALQDTLSNLFSGFYLTMTRQIRVGDYIKLESGQEGYVEDIGWRATTIRMLPNNMVLVPNNKLSQSIITNYYLPNRELAVLVEVGVDYSSDLAGIERITCEVGREVMRTVAGGVADFEPVIRYHAFGEYSVNFTVVLRAKEFVDQYLIKHEFIKRLHVRYRQDGITIPFPTRTVLTKDVE